MAVEANGDANVGLGGVCLHRADGLHPAVFPDPVAHRRGGLVGASVGRGGVSGGRGGVAVELSCRTATDTERMIGGWRGNDCASSIQWMRFFNRWGRMLTRGGVRRDVLLAKT